MKRDFEKEIQFRDKVAPAICAVQALLLSIRIEKWYLKSIKNQIRTYGNKTDMINLEFLSIEVIQYFRSGGHYFWSVKYEEFSEDFEGRYIRKIKVTLAAQI